METLITTYGPIPGGSTLTHTHLKALHARGLEVTALDFERGGLEASWAAGQSVPAAQRPGAAARLG